MTGDPFGKKSKAVAACRPPLFFKFNAAEKEMIKTVSRVYEDVPNKTTFK